MKKTNLQILAGLFLLMSILSCNTMNGAGKDIENAGQSIQKTVEHND